ncbi:MAG: SOS response-associated peptidase [Rubrobacteraceae bacterium]|nr:SOS response-associated peptidase [Rubrobacteraceae bacterium]
MCGRYTLSTPVGKLAEEFGLTGKLPDLQPSYNVAPTREVPAVVSGDGGRRLELLRWGLIPSWADDPGIGSRMINARSETVAEKPSFRRAFKKSRCLMLADGFYEWRKENGGKQPYYVRMKSGQPFAFAGLWESWNKGEGGRIHSCAIITTDANDLMREIHHRMPVIMPPEYYELWLDPAVSEPEELLPLLEPYPAADMEAYPVSRRVNSPSNDEPSCVERVA